jgi:hypothetical protein
LAIFYGDNMADDKSNGGNGNGAIASLEFKHSVKKEEYSENAGLFNYLIPAYGYNGRDYVALPQYLPASNSGYMYHTSRDMTLMSTVEHEAVWSNAVNIATQKTASWGWEITSEIALRQKRAQELIQDFEWLGIADYTTAISAHLKGYLLTGRAFIEVERATSSRFSKVIALHHLDPMSCMLTGDPRKPVCYMDTKGNIHELNDYDVGVFVMNPSPIERPYFFNSRPYQSPAESVYDQITQMEAIWRYLYEKTTGKRALSIDFVTGVATKQMQDIVVSADADMERKGSTLYKGSILVPIAQADAGISHVRIDLAGLPDGFDFQKIYDNTVITYASALGLDVNDLDPRLAQRQSLGSATQASLLDAKTQTKGLVIWRAQFTRFMQRLVLDDATSFSWRETSTEELTKEAEKNGKIIANVKTMIDAQIITNQQGLNILVDEEVLPREFLDVDLTQGNSIGDDEKDIAQPKDPNAPKPEQPQNGAGSEVIPQGTNTATSQQASNGGNSTPATRAKEWDVRLKHRRFRHNQRNHGNRSGVPAKGSDKWNAMVAGARGTSVADIPKEVALKPNGKPVGDALLIAGVGKTSNSVRNVVEAISKVHGDGNLPQVPVVITNTKTTMGEYRVSPNGKPQGIDVSSEGDHPDLTAAHEIGHFLDFAGLGKKKMVGASEENLAIMKEWENAVENSEAFKSMRGMLKSPDLGVVTVKVDGRNYDIRPDKTYIEFSLTKREAFARSYAQYVAVRSGNKTMLEQLTAGRKRWLYPVQWSDTDFEPIATAMDNLFKSQGWIE